MKIKDVDVALKGLPELGKAKNVVDPESVEAQTEIPTPHKLPPDSEKLHDNISDDAKGPRVPSVVIVPPVREVPHRR